MDSLLQELARVLEERKGAEPGSSYVAGLYARGPEAILKKVGEEATELVMAGLGADDQAVVHETADLWFHTLVLLAQRGLGPEQVLEELARRFGRSGIEEKAARG
ncbi:MAG: phosphoribosyl-ATP diphosphatase [Gammaproteobacteria bacterium]|jgi:phosphoribosyl-ATP pyrophosphohydrolase|nr:phosphoribosyl-ATP diphosphatase [Gammaproteobacteria bacterium]